MDAKPFLTLHEYHLSREKAREAIIAVLNQGAGSRLKTVDWKNGSIDIASGEITKSVRFEELEIEARRTGVVRTFQRLIDMRDGVFGGTLGESSTPNHQIKIRTQYAGWDKETEGPCRIAVATDDLMEDILHYRAEACRASSDYGFRQLARHYRAYLAACISIVDAFINHHILIASHDKFESDEFSRLKLARGMEEKIDCWIQMCCGSKTFAQLAKRKEWCHFQQLRQERNALHHAVEPFSVYAVKEIARFLNYTQTGIGQLLRLLREWHGKPSLLFIERLRTAPVVQFHSITLKAES